MKKNSLLIVFAFIFFSCNSEENSPSDPQTQDEYIQVPIGFSGEITSITESPFSRANDPKDNYVFQVYSKPDNDTDGYYSYYAYGFFDNKENMIINLKTGYKYKFDVCMVVDGSNKVNTYCLYNSGWAGISNTFYISSTESVRYMYEGYLYLPSGKFDRPNVDRFYGETVDYIPTEGGSVQINMKRVSFGVKVIANNFDSGKLEVSIENAPTITMDAMIGNKAEDIISFKNLRGGYISPDSYSENIPVNITWVKTDNARVPIASQSIAFKRNVYTTLEVTIKENTTGNSFNFNTDETMGDGTKHTLDNKDGNDTGVNPSN